MKKHFVLKTVTMTSAVHSIAVAEKPLYSEEYDSDRDSDSDSDSDDEDVIHRNTPSPIALVIDGVRILCACERCSFVKKC